MDIQSILTEIEQDEEAFAKKHGGTSATLDRLSAVISTATAKGEPSVQISLFSSPRERLYLWDHKGNMHEHIGKHAVVIRDSVGNVVRLIGLVDKTN